MSGMPKLVQAKHIADTEFLGLVWNTSIVLNSKRVMWWDILPVLERCGFPEGVVYAKARALLKRGFLEGCVHDGKIQCRGDLELTERGQEALRQSFLAALESA